MELVLRMAGDRENLEVAEHTSPAADRQPWSLFL